MRLQLIVRTDASQNSRAIFSLVPSLRTEFVLLADDILNLTRETETSEDEVGKKVAE